MSKAIRNFQQQPFQRPPLIRRNAATDPRELQLSSRRVNELTGLRAPANHTPAPTAVQTMANQIQIAVLMVSVNPDRQIRRPRDEMNISVPVPVRGRDLSGIPTMGMDSHQAGNVDNNGTVVEPPNSSNENANANRPETVQADTENVQSDAGTVQADSEAFQSEPDDIGSETEDFQSEPDEFNTETETETVQPNTEGFQSETKAETEPVPEPENNESHQA